MWYWRLCQKVSSLRRQHRRRRRARCRFLPDEGRDPGLSYGMVRKSGQAGTPPRVSGRGLRPGRRRPKRVRPAMSISRRWWPTIGKRWSSLSSVPAGKLWWRSTSIRLPRRSSIPRICRKHVFGFQMYDVQKTKGNAGSLDLSVYDRSEAPRQRLWSGGAEQGSGGVRAMVNRISIGHMPENPVKRFYGSFGFVEGAGPRCRRDLGSETVMSDDTVAALVPRSGPPES